MEQSICDSLSSIECLPDEILGMIMSGCANDSLFFTSRRLFQLMNKLDFSTQVLLTEKGLEEDVKESETINNVHRKLRLVTGQSWFSHLHIAAVTMRRCAARTVLLCIDKFEQKLQHYEAVRTALSKDARIWYPKKSSLVVVWQGRDNGTPGLVLVRLYMKADPETVGSVDLSFEAQLTIDYYPADSDSCSDSLTTQSSKRPESFKLSQLHDQVFDLNQDTATIAHSLGLWSKMGCLILIHPQAVRLIGNIAVLHPGILRGPWTEGQLKGLKAILEHIAESNEKHRHIRSLSSIQFEAAEEGLLTAINDANFHALALLTGNFNPRGCQASREKHGPFVPEDFDPVCDGVRMKASEIPELGICLDLILREEHVRALINGYYREPVPYMEIIEHFFSPPRLRPNFDSKIGDNFEISEFSSKIINDFCKLMIDAPDYHKIDLERFSSWLVSQPQRYEPELSNERSR